MKSKILSLTFTLSAILFCESAKAQIIPTDCQNIITDLAKLPPNTSQAATDAMACVQDIAGAVATPLCQAGCPNGGTTPADCASPCQPLCTSQYGAHNVACCLESLAANKVTLPTAVNTVLGGICGAFAYSVPVVGSWCTVIPNATAQQALPYIGYICCNYTAITQQDDVSACLATTNPPFACSSYTNLSPQICGAGAAQSQKKEKDKK